MRRPRVSRAIRIRETLQRVNVMAIDGAFQRAHPLWTHVQEIGGRELLFFSAARMLPALDRRLIGLPTQGARWNGREHCGESDVLLPVRRFTSGAIYLLVGAFGRPIRNVHLAAGDNPACGAEIGRGLGGSEREIPVGVRAREAFIRAVRNCYNSAHSGGQESNRRTTSHPRNCRGGLRPYVLLRCGIPDAWPGAWLLISRRIR